ncbi:MAG: ATP-dependent DNA helicase [Deltaproteobacteria bacterium]|nr:ATP-dependent DNA helicase [Deltaproteobacteria bacterium]
MSLAGKTRAFFAPGGPLSRAVKGYEERPSQVRMAEAVAQALCDGGFLIAEAGTGTGKTLAYIVPAVLSGRKVIVSTATRHLQEQVAQSDAALVAQALKKANEGGFTPPERAGGPGGKSTVASPGRTVLLKGRANYLCRRKLAMFPALGAAGAEKAVLQWAAATKTGDRSGCADVSENDPVWSGFVSDHEGCLGHRCRFQKKCFVEAAKAGAAEAEIVVVNHHLFFADLAIRSGSEGGVLPEYDTVFFDEAHAVEDVAATHFGKSAGSVELDMLLKAASALRRGKGKGGGRLHEAAPRVRGAGAQFFAAFVAGPSPFRSGGAAQRFDSSSIPQNAPQTHMQLDNALDSLSAAVRTVAESNDPPAEAERVLGRISEFRNALAFIMEARAPGYVFFFETAPQHSGPPRVTVTAFPLDIGGILNTVLYPTLKTAVFTSATLSTGGNLAYMADRLGLPAAAADSRLTTHDVRPATGDRRPAIGGQRSEVRGRRTESGSALSLGALVLPAPFDYASQACLYVPDGLPEPNDARFTREAVAQIDRLCAITAGRAFVLCTSRRQMDAYHEALKSRLPYDVYKQGDLPKTAILDRYRGGRPGVLFATASFWEGVDVPGEALSLVIMDRIPFAPPDEPTTQARIEKLREAGRDPWSEFQLPQATLALKQGFGRLIRTRSDRGIVAVLDTRLLSKGYGKYILGSLPRLSLFTDTAQVRKWWDAGRSSSVVSR